MSILIVDDEPKNIQLLGNQLKDEYHIEFALSGEEVLDWVLNYKFDIILLDIMMPGLDGIEVCKRLKTDPKSKDTPIDRRHSHETPVRCPFLDQLIYTAAIFHGSFYQSAGIVDRLRHRHATLPLTFFRLSSDACAFKASEDLLQPAPSQIVLIQHLNRDLA